MGLMMTFFIKFSSLATLTTIQLLSLASYAFAPESFQQAQSIAVQSNKPILIEFYRDD